MQKRRLNNYIYRNTPYIYFFFKYHNKVYLFNLLLYFLFNKINLI